MQQDRPDFFKEKGDLMKYSTEKCCPLGLLSQQGIDYNIYEQNKKCP